jgi:hypothetical protein
MVIHQGRYELFNDEASKSRIFHCDFVGTTIRNTATSRVVLTLANFA